MKESYFGKTFEGNECSKLMTKICDDKFNINIPALKNHLIAIKKFNDVRKKMLGNELKKGWEQSIKDFHKAYNEVPKITKPLKAHILFAHCEEYIKIYGRYKGLGFYSEQTGEAIHQKFETVFTKYKIKNINDNQFGERLRRAVVEFSSTYL